MTFIRQYCSACSKAMHLKRGKMDSKVKLGIIICNRYRTCAGGKCLRAMRERVGAFQRYSGSEVELVGYTTCDGCPGGNIEYTGEEMVKNGAQVIHLATDFLVGYPPCPSTQYFKEYLEKRYQVEVVIGTHPIPEKYYDMHDQLCTWQDESWEPLLKEVLTNEVVRKAYN